MLKLAQHLKHQYFTEGGNAPILHNKTLALILERPSLRTRISFEMAMQHLGGHCLFIRNEEIGWGKREAIADIARVLGNYVHGLMCRVSHYEDLLELAKFSSIPVINGLTEFNHPCQAMADVLTIYEEFQQLRGVRVAYVGPSDQDVPRSLLFAATKFEFELVVCSPDEYCLSEAELSLVGEVTGIPIARRVLDPWDAVQGAQVIYTDVWDGRGTWNSMPDEEVEWRVQLLQPYQINSDLVSYAEPDAIVMHCMPINRDEEMTSEVADSPQSRLFPQAANRLHSQKAILAHLLADHPLPR